jgi:hypothetical protein
MLLRLWRGRSKEYRCVIGVMMQPCDQKGRNLLKMARTDEQAEASGIFGRIDCGELNFCQLPAHGNQLRSIKLYQLRMPHGFVLCANTGHNALLFTQTCFIYM